MCIAFITKELSTVNLLREVSMHVLLPQAVSCSFFFSVKSTEVSYTDMRVSPRLSYLPITVNKNFFL